LATVMLHGWFYNPYPIGKLKSKQKSQQNPASKAGAILEVQIPHWNTWTDTDTNHCRYQTRWIFM